MPIADNDPRVFFASERTLLAWLRTGLAIIGLGFLVSRFGLFVRLMALQTADAQLDGGHVLSGILGIALVVVGSLAIIIAAVQHRRFAATLALQDLPPLYSRRFAVSLSVMVGLLGLGLAGYLAITEG